MQIQDENRLLTLTQAAEIAKVNRVSVFRWIQNKKLSATKAGTAGYLIKESDLTEWLAIRSDKQKVLTANQ